MVCGKKKGMRSKVDTWWWNKEVKGAVSRKKEAHKAMRINSTEENKRRHKSMKNKAVSKETREKSEAVLTEIQNFPYWMVRLEKELKTDSKEVEGGKCMRGSGGKLCYSEKERGNLWKDYMEGIIMWRRCSRRSSSLCR